MKEVRAIIFDKDEVTKAILQRRHNVREALPKGTARELTYMDGADGINIMLKIEDDFGDVDVIHISGAEVIAALIMYCMDRKVPLPHRADKFLDVVQQQLMVVVDVEIGATSRPLKPRAKGAARPRGPARSGP